ncbi:MAG: YihY family inner membrane protein [Rhodocyclaceae bacterium]|nr:YihY family inner membrane protein [Rhodocyclaceae bacterium]
MSTRSASKTRFRVIAMPLLLRASHRFIVDDFHQLSASLAFTTLLSLVPLAALVLAFVSAFPQFASSVDHVDKMLVSHLLPPGSGGLIAGKILQFSRRAADVSWVGVGMLVITAFLLLNTIERAFNHAWQVKVPRPLWQRIPLYMIVIVVWPLLVGGVLAGISYAVTTSLGLVGQLGWLRATMLKIVSLFVLMVFFAFIYRAVPNSEVRWRAAGIAGAFAAIGFVLLQKAFELYLSYFPSYKAIYGAFAVVPLFLLWVYLSWAVVLFGALIAALLPEFEGAARGRRR